jgi:hypothetical protein
VGARPIYQQHSHVFIWATVTICLWLYGLAFTANHNLDAVPLSEVPVETSKMNAYFQLGPGIDNGLKSEMGPWWITSPISDVQVINPTTSNIDLRFGVRISLAMCATPRVVWITFANQTKTLDLRSDQSSSTATFRATLEPKKYYSLVLQIDGPVCQTDIDPRVFWGQLFMEKFDSSQISEYDFSS